MKIILTFQIITSEKIYFTKIKKGNIENFGRIISIDKICEQVQIRNNRYTYAVGIHTSKCYLESYNFDNGSDLGLKLNESLCYFSSNNDKLPMSDYIQYVYYDDDDNVVMARKTI